MFDLRVVIDWELDARAARFDPLPGLRYERTTAAAGSETVAAAASLLGVAAADRLGQDVFVATNGDGHVVACSWNDPPSEGIVRQRGLMVAPSQRGRALGGNMLLCQAAGLGSEGVRTVMYHTEVGNRASRRMLHRIGARWNRLELLVVVFGRRVMLRRISGPLEGFFRTGYERERREVMGG